MKTTFCILMLASCLSTGTAAAECASSQHRTGLAAFALSPDGSRIGAVAHDGTVFWWDVVSGERKRLLGCADSSWLSTPIVFSPDSSLLALGDQSGKIVIFEVTSGKILYKLTGHSGQVYAIAFSADGRRLAANNREGLSVWSLAEQKEMMSTRSSDDNAFALNRTGTLLATNGKCGIDLWDTEQAQLSGKIELRERQHAQSLLFAQDDSILVAALADARPVRPGDRQVQYDYDIAIWEPSSGRKLRTFSRSSKAPPGFPMAVAGSRLLEMSYDENLRQWDLKTGRLKATWETTPGYVGANGKFFLKEAGPPGHLELWKIGPPNKKLQTFEYRSPTCGPSILDAATADDGIDTFEVTWMGNGFTKDGYMLGLSGWVARDCTEILRTNAYFNSAERAQEELQYDIQRANRIIRPEAAAGSVKNVLPGEKAVLVFVDAKSHLETMAVVWTDGNTYCKTSTLSLPVALRLADNTQSDSSKR